MSECPTCEKEFETTKGMRVHHFRSHGEKLLQESECNHCGETWKHRQDVTKPHKYCSVECRDKDKRDRITIECEECDTEFEVQRSRTERRFCSTDCKYNARSKKTKQTCEQCNRTYKTHEFEDRKYCCQACRWEDQTKKPRPDDERMLLWLFYVYEDWTIDHTYRRVRAYLGNDNRMMKHEIRDTLIEMGLHENKRALNNALVNMDPEELSATPEGDDSWKALYSD